MYLLHSIIYFTLPQGGSSLPLVQLKEMIPTSNLYKYLFSSFLHYLLNNLIKRKGLGFALSRENCQIILLFLERNLEAAIPRKGRAFSAGRKEKKSTGGKISQLYIAIAIS